MGCGPADGPGSEAGQAVGSESSLAASLEWELMALGQMWGPGFWAEQGSPGDWAGTGGAGGILQALAVSSSFVISNLIMGKNLALFSYL